ncbi:MAG TPA: alpha/beta fold hydrolase [Frankiaceae bacterium]|nr:alpha/beta fold hydrolase [Frankiaceae bacterium]
MPAVKTVARLPAAVTEFSNILLTTKDVEVGVSAKDVVWTHRKVTLYRYRNTRRTHDVPVLLVFALINRPDIFDLAPGSSFVEYLLDEGYDVFLLDWGVPDDEDADMGLDTYVCDEIHAGVRETLRASGAPQVTLLGWCIGATLCAMYVALMRDRVLPALPTAAQSGPDAVDPVRNLVVLTMPVDPSGSLYTDWVGGDELDVDYVADRLPVIPGRAIDWANKTMKPVTNWWATYRKLFSQVLDGSVRRESYQPMAHWVGDNPPFPSRAFRQWVTWMYKENRLVKGTLRLRDAQVDLGSVDVPLLVVTAGADHIAPRHTTLPLLDLVSSPDVTHLDRPGGHIGLMAGSKARKEIWPDLVAWLNDRSNARSERQETA